MEQDERQQALLFANIAAQLRGALSNLRLAASQLVPPAQREQDPELDARAALLDQSYYQLLRLVNDLSAASQYLGGGQPLPLQDRDIVDTVRELCVQAEGPRHCWAWSSGLSAPRTSTCAPFIRRAWSCWSTSCYPTLSSSRPPAAPSPWS